MCNDDESESRDAFCDIRRLSCSTLDLWSQTEKPEPEWNFGADKDREIFGRLGVAVDVGGAAHGN